LKVVMLMTGEIPMRARTPLRTLLLVAALATSAVAQQPKGVLGIDEARRGGVVIACRHAMTASADEDEKTLRYEDPSTQRRLSAEGERQAEALGKAFRDLRIPVGEVIASPMQRTRRTAELAFGGAQLDSNWHTRGDYYGGPKRDRRSEMLGRPVDGGTRVIVSHIGTMYSVLPSIRGELEEGDCVVVRPRGGSQYSVIEVVPWRSWLRAAGDTSTSMRQGQGRTAELPE
jgi:phosphohistidine phosphatase SixA